MTRYDFLSTRKVFEPGLQTNNDFTQKNDLNQIFFLSKTDFCNKNHDFVY